MRRLFWSVVLMAALGGVWTTPSSAAPPISVVVNGAVLVFADQQPVLVQDRVLVPLRGVFEALGARVAWSPANQSVSGTRGSTIVQLMVGSVDASVNSHPVQLDVPPQLIGGRVMVPLRFVGESLGAKVGWMDATQTVTIALAPLSIGEFPPKHHRPDFTPPNANPPREPRQNNSPHDTGPPKGPRPVITPSVIAPPVVNRPVVAPPVITPPAVVTPQATPSHPNTVASAPGDYPRVVVTNPPANAVVQGVAPAIYAMIGAGTSSIDVARTQMWVNNNDVTQQANVSPQFVSYIPTAPLAPGPVNVKVLTTDANGLTTTKTWQFVQR